MNPSHPKPSLPIAPHSAIQGRPAIHPLVARNLDVTARRIFIPNDPLVIALEASAGCTASVRNNVKLADFAGCFGEQGWRGLADLVHKSVWVSRFAKMHIDGQLSLRTAKLSIIDFLRSEIDMPVIYDRHIVDALRQNLDRRDTRFLDSLISTLCEQHAEQLQTKINNYRTESIKMFITKEPVALTLLVPDKDSL